MRIAICDDNLLFIEQLTSYIKDYFKRCHLSCPEIISFHSGEALLEDTLSKDIVFLDIEMPGLSGISTGAELKKTTKILLSLSLPHMQNI